MAIVELVPTAQGIATSLDEIGNVTAGQVDTPVLVGGGSVSDGSDSSYVEIGARYDPTIAASHLEILTADFSMTGGVPTAMGVQIRGSTPTATLASPPSGNRYLWAVWTAVADGSFLGSQSYPGGAFDSLAWCYQSGPATLETYWGNALDRANPTDPGNWCELAPVADGGGEMSGAYEALTGAGIRVSVFVDHWAVGFPGPPASRVPWVNIHELRLVVAQESVAIPYVPPALARPSLRMLQRGGSGGMSGIPRMVGDPTRRGSLRQGPGSVY